jgi:hypothetical protein
MRALIMAARYNQHSERHVFTTDVPAEVGRKLVQIAAAERRSVSSTIKNLLEDALQAREVPARRA